MREEFLHFVWQHQLFNHANLKTIGDGETVQIITPGLLNKNAGPDFSSAKIRINEQIWVGNIELHIKASDWFNHNHHLDPAYKNVILHVIYEPKPISNVAIQTRIPLLNLYGRIDLHRYYQWEKMIHQSEWIPCEKHLPQVPSVVVQQTIDRLAVERLQRKTQTITEWYNSMNGHWEKTLLIAVSSALGAHINSEPFTILARLIPLGLVKRLEKSSADLEALVFGLAGLTDQKSDEYQIALHEKYRFLKHKYGFESMNSSQWKFLRMRPANFPTLRLAQFSALLLNWSTLVHCIFNGGDDYQLKELLAPHVSPYWVYHYSFGKPSGKEIRKIGRQKIDSIIINAIVPVIYSYGLVNGEQEQKEKAQNLLEKTRPEMNRIIKTWNSLGIKAKNAFESQGLLELKNEYCTSKKCLYCKTGAWIINQK